MVFTIEPGIYIPGVRVEELCTCNQEWCRSPFHLQKFLIVAEHNFKENIEEFKI